jgi:hypothetical protein
MEGGGEVLDMTEEDFAVKGEAMDASPSRTICAACAQ